MCFDREGCGVTERCVVLIVRGRRRGTTRTTTTQVRQEKRQKCDKKNDTSETRTPTQVRQEEQEQQQQHHQPPKDDKTNDTRTPPPPPTPVSRPAMPHSPSTACPMVCPQFRIARRPPSFGSSVTTSALIATDRRTISFRIECSRLCFARTPTEESAQRQRTVCVSGVGAVGQWRVERCCRAVSGMM